MRDPNRLQLDVRTNWEPGKKFFFVFDTVPESKRHVVARPLPIQRRHSAAYLCFIKNPGGYRK